MTILGYPYTRTTLPGFVAITIGEVNYLMLERDVPLKIRRYECELLAEWWSIEGGD